MAATAAKKPVKSAGPEIQKMEYDVYAGGINAVDATLNLALQPKDRYDIELTAATKGFLRVLAPWSGSFESHGWRRQDGLDQPQLHKSIATWRDEDEIKEYTYDQKGKFLQYSIKDEENDGSPKDVDPELTQGTTDALTAVLAIMKQVGKGDACAGTAEVFDGDRRFELTFVSQGPEDLKATRYNVYEGPSQKCAVEVKPKGGKWHEKPRGWLSIQEQGRQHGMLPTVWFAQLDPKGPAVPVKIMIKSDYGAMLAHLTGYSNNESVRSAQIVDGMEVEGAPPAAAPATASASAEAAPEQAAPAKNSNALRN
jgi:hypothetical protein